MYFLINERGMENLLYARRSYSYIPSTCLIGLKKKILKQVFLINEIYMENLLYARRSHFYIPSTCLIGLKNT